VVTVQDIGVQVSTVGPDNRAQLGIDANGTERGVVLGNLAEGRPLQKGREIDDALRAI
jgi:hypothetical protein